MLNDIAEEKKSEEKLKILASVFTHTSEAMMITKLDGTIYDVNEAFETITGYSRIEAIGNKPSILSSGYYEKEFYHIMWDSLIKIGNWSGEIWNLRKNGEIYAENLKINAIYNLEGVLEYYVALFSDITLSKKHLKELESIANYDKLTGLPNRRLLADRLQQNMIQVQRRDELLAVVFLDLDGFKKVNDTYGHEVGDKLLIALAKKMHSSLREEDTLARIGEDEFVAVLSNLTNIKNTLPLLNRLLKASAQRVNINGHSIKVSASLGITFYPQVEKIEADQLLRQADQAMYEAKIFGKNRYHIFDIKQDNFIRERYENIKYLQKALKENEFVLYYQPKVNMKTGEVIGAEALIRWNHPKKGILYPNEFLPIIYGDILTNHIGEWVMRTALKQVEQWQMIGLNIPISINISARHLLENNFVMRLKNILSEYPNVLPSFLKLEILETNKLEDIYKAEEVINSCKKFGIHFTLDDFGTGSSSLTYLKRLPITDIKIDKNFIGDMLKDPNELAILEIVIKLADIFQINVIAEGVETAEQRIALLKLGCELAQGNFISLPMPSREFPIWLKKWKSNILWDRKEVYKI